MTEEEVVALRERLNVLSNKLNIYIHQEEAYLEASALGVRTYIVTKSGYELGYDRIGDKWRIIARETETTWTLDHAPRGIRYSALKYLPQLREAIFKHAESLANRIEKALAGEFEDES